MNQNENRRGAAPRGAVARANAPGGPAAWRLARGFVIVSLSCWLAGCRARDGWLETPQPTPTKAAASNSKASDEAATPAASETEDAETAAARRAARRPPVALADITDPQAGLSAAEAARHVLAEAQAAAESGPTLLVWLLDQSPSAAKQVSGARTQARLFYKGLGGAASPAAQNNLHTAVLAFGKEATFLQEEPTNDPAAALAALERISVDSSGREAVFAAVGKALDKFETRRTEQRHEVLLLIVTDEAGDDLELLDGLTGRVARASLPVYVIGSPAPFGRRVGGDFAGMAAFAPPGRAGQGPEPDHHGPESREPELVSLAFSTGSVDYNSASAFSAGDHQLEALDAGFGPFGLERLCRASGGRFLAARPAAKPKEFDFSLGGRWPRSDTPRFDLQTLRRYAPDYVSADEYARLLQENRARQALHDAAKIARPNENLDMPDTAFVKRSEAELKRQLDEAQRKAARLEPIIQRFYDALSPGREDRDKLTGPRWQAGYDLAWGRVLAAKARVEGYNLMLASLKGGKEFQNPASTRWVLEPDDLTRGNSGIEKLIGQSREALERVVREHSGTPWALLAQRELDTRAGWKWTEK